MQMSGLFSVNKQEAEINPPNPAIHSGNSPQLSNELANLSQIQFYKMQPCLCLSDSTCLDREGGLR